MIEPLKSGQALIDEIASTELAAGMLAIWWLGQSGYLIKSPSGLLAIDLYLSEHLTDKYAKTAKPHVRMTAAPLRGQDLNDVDLILASHKHSDHLDPETLPELLDASKGAVLALPAALIEHAISLGLNQDRLIGLVADQSLTRAGFRIRSIPSAHETVDTDNEGRFLYLGFIIEVEGLRLYHSGDCVPYDGLLHALGHPQTSYDVAFLPINGRDPTRHVAGNMSAAEAVDLASTLRPRYVVPHHYDMFQFNTVPVSDFVTEAMRLPEGVNPRVLHCGERWILTRT